MLLKFVKMILQCAFIPLEVTCECLTYSLTVYCIFRIKSLERIYQALVLFSVTAALCTYLRNKSQRICFNCFKIDKRIK